MNATPCFRKLSQVAAGASSCPRTTTAAVFTRKGQCVQSKSRCTVKLIDIVSGLETRLYRRKSRQPLLNIKYVFDLSATVYDRQPQVASDHTKAAAVFNPAATLSKPKAIGSKAKDHRI